MWWILTTLFFLISIVTSVLLYYSLKRINNYEQFIVKIQQIISYASLEIKKVDVSGHYESDDETGFFFQQLKDLQNLLNSIFEPQLQEKENAEKEN